MIVVNIMPRTCKIRITSHQKELFMTHLVDPHDFFHYLSSLGSRANLI